MMPQYSGREARQSWIVKTSARSNESNWLLRNQQRSNGQRFNGFDLHVSAERGCVEDQLQEE
jgi:hypothetical protein